MINNLAETLSASPVFESDRNEAMRRSLQTLSQQTSMQLTVTLDPAWWLILARVADKRGVTIDQLASEALPDGLESVADELSGLSAS